MSRKLQFLEDSILLRTARLRNMCESLQLITHLMRIAALKESTHFAILQFNTTAIVAKATTNGYLMVYHCMETPIKFTMMFDKDSCYQLIPIEYKNNRQTWEQGFLNPENSVIHRDSAKLDCVNPPKTLFTIDEQIYSYLPGHIPVSIDSSKETILPILVSNMTQSLLHFPEHWSFDKSDISHVTSEEAVASFLSQELSSVKNFETSKPKSHVSKVMEYFALMSESPGHIFNFIITWLFRTITIVTAFIVFHETFDIFRFFRRARRNRRITRYATPYHHVDMPPVPAQ